MDTPAEPKVPEAVTSIEYTPLPPAVVAGIHTALKEKGQTGIVLGRHPNGEVHIKLTTPQAASNLAMELNAGDFDALLPDMKPDIKSLVKVNLPPSAIRARTRNRPTGSRGFIVGSRRRK